MLSPGVSGNPWPSSKEAKSGGTWREKGHGSSQQGEQGFPAQEKCVPRLGAEEGPGVQEGGKWLRVTTDLEFKRPVPQACLEK